MTSHSELHRIADELLVQEGSLLDVFDQALLSTPIKQPLAERRMREARYQSIVSLFQIALKIFRACVTNDTSPVLRSFLLNDSSAALPPSYYQRLPENVWTVPAFFRTDEARIGTIYELQCPGSGWGDLFLLTGVYEASGALDSHTSERLRDLVAENLRVAAGASMPAILHLLDNSSNPSSMRHFMRKTQPPARYFGYTRGLRSIDCQLVRSHSVQGLVAENLFAARLRLAAEGRVRFDLPPIMLFDQKMLMCLPFLTETREHFDDEIRGHLVHTAPVTVEGFLDTDGSQVSLDEFICRASKHRRYYLKYGGCDTSVNWGSRGVFRLDGSDAEQRLRQAAADSTKGRPWVIQPEVGDKVQVTYRSRSLNTLQDERLTAKYSSFYGPCGLIGVRSQYRRGTKVHGQPDTAAGIVL